MRRVFSRAARVFVRVAMGGVLLAVLSAFTSGQVIKGSKPAPSGSSILVPNGAFPGGVLTGVVIGPDDQPVANAPVNVSGVPVTLTGVVIGDEQPQRPQPDHPKPGEKPPVDKPSLNLLQACAGLLQQFGGAVAPGQAGASPTAVETPTAVEAGGAQVTTDAAGRFAMCIPVDAPKVQVSLPGGESESIPAVHDVAERVAQREPPAFFQPNERVTLAGRLRQPTMEQGGQSWQLLAVQSLSPDGSQALTAFKTPRGLQPGPATLSFVDAFGQARSFTGGVFKIVSAKLDHSKLRSNEGADFDYEAVFSPQWGGRQLCINVGTTGPIILVKPPVERLAVNGDGHASIQGKIRATQVAPGSAVPFAIQLKVSQCGAGPQTVGEKGPGPSGASGERGPGPPGSPSDTEMKLSLTPGPVAVNPFVTQDDKDVAVPPQAVTMKPPVPNLGPEHTMDATSKYAKAPPPISSCRFQTTTPVINSVEGVTQPTVFTQQQGLNYFTVHGCNFGSTAGHVYLVLHPDFGPGFPNAVELYRMNGNNPWGPDTINVYLDPNFGGYLDQTGDVLRVVTAKGLTAELPHQVFHAERVDTVTAWLPRSQVTLGATSDPLTPVFKTAATSQTDSLVIMERGNQGSTMTATVTRSISNVGGPFTVQDDLWDFSALRPGFVVKYATPYYQNWNGSGCDQTTGKWGTQWDSATLLRIHVQGCFQSGWGSGHTSSAQYGLQIELRGPKGVLAWPPELH